MNVYPDGEALSDWERQILEDIEQDFEVTDPGLVAFLFGGDPAPVHVLGPYLVVAEAAVAFAALTASVACTLAGLATIGTTIWITSVRAAPGLRAAPGRALRGRP